MILKIHRRHHLLRRTLYEAHLFRRNVYTTSEEAKILKKQVIDLYKNLIYLSREWHTDLRPQIKNAFMKNKDVSNPEEIKKLIGRGEYISRELTATYQLKKYRAMKRRYYNDDESKHLQEIFQSYKDL